MKILVIGATSFWGYPLVESLDRSGHEVSVFSRDPRAFPDHWRLRLKCSFGEISHAHILEEALMGVHRVVTCLSPGYDKERAEEIEVGGIRSILESAKTAGCQGVVRLTTPSPLRQADWWPMAVRRRADLIAETSSIPTCLAEMGWAPEMLAPLRRGPQIWLPHPRSAPCRLRWQSRANGVARLTELVARENLPKRITLRGDDPASIAELSTRICRDHARTERIFLPGRVYAWMSPFFPAVSHAGQRLIQAARQHETTQRSGAENSLVDWR
ncbi:MAG: NAD(P)H-binding protein [Fibrobacterota bacterium]